MGGDRGPEIVARAAVEAAKSDPSNLTMVIVGDGQRLESILGDIASVPANVEIVHASETVGMSEAPALAIRKKKDSSIAVALGLMKDRSVDGIVSAGNTGAMVGGSLVTLGRLHGVTRPGLAMFYPTKSGWVVVLDIGANSTCVPQNLYQFGIMGSIFAECHLDVSNPRVGLLNIGEESSKGTEIVKEAYQLLKHGNLNFVGNVEGGDVFGGGVDVVVCDGFVGNILLKFGESIVGITTNLLREEIKRSLLAKLGAVLMKRVFSTFRSRLDYAEFGGAPLLGINGVIIICHGKSSVRAIRNGINMARRFVEYDVNKHIEERFIKTADNVAKES